LQLFGEDLLFLLNHGGNGWRQSEYIEDGDSCSW